MTLDEDGRISAMDVFVLPRHFATWGHPPALEVIGSSGFPEAHEVIPRQE
jgi:hypothetical protein